MKRRTLAIALSLILLSQLSAGAEPLVTAQLAESMPLVGIDRVHAEYGLSGQGVGIYIIDYFSRSDSSDHGWYVKGIIEAIAPAASIYTCDLNVYDGFTGSTSCIAQLLSDRELARRIDLVNASFTTGTFTNQSSPDCTVDAVLAGKLVTQFAEFMRERALIAAVGNRTDRKSLLFPACLPDVISVGASIDSGENVDELANFSNRPRFMDLVAPGAPSVTPPGGVPFFGTSAATPIVTGVSALLLEADFSQSPSQIRTLLMETGDPAFDPLNNRFYPRVNALSAVRSIMGKPRILPGGRPIIEILSGKLSADKIAQGDELCVDALVHNRGGQGSELLKIYGERMLLHSVELEFNFDQTERLLVCFDLFLVGTHPVELSIAAETFALGQIIVAKFEPRSPIITLPPGDSNGALLMFDTNENSLIDDEEFFAVVDLWIDNQLTDSMFFSIIDIWIGGVRIQRTSENRERSSAFAIYALSGNWVDSGRCSTRPALMARKRLAYRELSNGTYVVLFTDCQTGVERVSFISIVK